MAGLTAFGVPVNIERAARASLRTVAASAALILGAGGLAVAGLGAAALAQSDAGAPPPGAAAAGRHRMAEALMSLGLSDDQKTRIRDIMKAARAKNTPDTDPATRRANYEAARAKIDTVLTPDQRTRLHAKIDQMRKEREQGSQS